MEISLSLNFFKYLFIDLFIFLKYFSLLKNKLIINTLVLYELSLTYIYIYIYIYSHQLIHVVNSDFRCTYVIV
jgi:hypothetical protein